MRVVVHGYTYEADDSLELQVGDEVILPNSGTGIWRGKVIALTSDYPGSCSTVLGLSKRATPVTATSAKPR